MVRFLAMDAGIPKRNESEKSVCHMSISAKELAQRIHVSPATISMVFNNKPGISETTRKLVLEAAKKYDYIPPKASGAEKRTIQLVIYQKHAMVVSDTPFFSQVIEGITQGCSEQNCIVNINYLTESSDIQPQIKNINSMSGGGMILLGTEMNREDFDIFRGLGIPVVVLDCYYDELDYDCIVINNSQGAYCATDYLAKMGHKKIGYLHSAVSISNFEERAAGYQKALKAHALPDLQGYVLQIASTSAQGYQDMVRILEQKPELADAYFADNDIIAAAAMKAFQEYGYKVPEDISIVGFDDMPLCDIMNPPLSTMRVDKKQLGRSAVECLLSRMNGAKHGKLKIALQTALVCRESVLDMR